MTSPVIADELYQTNWLVSETMGFETGGIAKCSVDAPSKERMREACCRGTANGNPGVK